MTTHTCIRTLCDWIRLVYLQQERKRMSANTLAWEEERSRLTEELRCAREQSAAAEAGMRRWRREADESAAQLQRLERLEQRACVPDLCLSDWRHISLSHYEVYARCFIPPFRSDHQDDAQSEELARLRKALHTVRRQRDEAWRDRAKLLALVRNSSAPSDHAGPKHTEEDNDV